MGETTIGMRVIQLNDKPTAKWKKSLFPGKTKSVPLILPRYVSNELVMSLQNVFENRVYMIHLCEIGALWAGSRSKECKICLFHSLIQ